MDELRKLTAILIERLTPEQLHAVLEGITAHFDHGCCPLCWLEEVPIGTEWQEQHTDECPVTLIEAAIMTEKAKSKVKGETR